MLQLIDLMKLRKEVIVFRIGVITALSLSLILGIGALAQTTQSETEVPGIRVTPDDDLQAAINQAPVGAKILLASGTYTGNFVINKDLEIVSEQSGKAVLQGKELQKPVLRIEGDGVKVKIEGLVVQKALGKECAREYPDWLCADGISACGSVSVTIVKVTVRGNGSHGIAGYLGASLSIQQSEITRNVGAGLFLRDGSIAEVQDTVITENSTGVYCWLDDATCTIESSEISANDRGVLVDYGGRFYAKDLQVLDNDGFGIWLTDDGRAELEECEIDGNKIGVVAEDRTRITLKSTTVSSHFGAGLQGGGRSRITLEDCTVELNGGHGLDLSDSCRATIRNTVISDNAGNGISLLESPRVTIVDSEITGNGEWGIFSHLEKCGWTTDAFTGVVLIRDTEVSDNEAGDTCLPE